MDHELHSRLRYELMLLNEAKDEYSSMLHSLNRTSDLTDLVLKENKKKYGTYYYYKRKGQKRFKYLGNDKHVQVFRIKKVKHIQKSIAAIEDDIALIEMLLNGFKDYDPGSVDSLLPAVYQGSMQFPISEYQIKGKLWKENNLAFQACFPENYPEYKTEQASDGTMLKTLSEVLIYERLLAAGLISIYELPIPVNDYGPNLYPDFTVLSPLDLKTEIIIEYAGRLDLPKYREDFAKRIHRYMQNGYIPGVNLFFIFGDERGHVDSMQINKIIADIKGLR